MGMDKSEAARALGSVRSDAKKQAARQRYEQQVAESGYPNKPKSLSEIACHCGVGDSMEGHKSTCLRGRAIKRRLQKGQPLE